MLITKTDNTVLLPGNKGSTHDGRNSRSTFVTFNNPLYLTHGQELRIWYKEDRMKWSEQDNHGSVFMYVLAIKQD